MARIRTWNNEEHIEIFPEEIYEDDFVYISFENSTRINVYKKEGIHFKIKASIVFKEPQSKNQVYIREQKDGSWDFTCIKGTQILALENYANGYLKSIRKNPEFNTEWGGPDEVEVPYVDHNEGWMMG